MIKALCRPFRLLALAVTLLISSGHLFPAAGITDLEMLNYKACFDGVPLRQNPDTFAPRMVTLSKGTIVKVDIQRGDWLRVIYKVPQGYFIGWCLATMMCPVN